MKIFKPMKFLVPFIESTKGLVPLGRIRAVRGYKVKKGLTERSYGSTIKETKYFTINLLTHHIIDNKYKALPLHSILDSLAHELAHTVCWEHTSDHYKLQSKIQLKFSEVLKQLEIKDTSQRFN